MFFKTRIQLYNIPDFLFGYNSGILSCLLKRQIHKNREYAVSRYILKVGRSRVQLLVQVAAQLMTVAFVGSQ